MITRTLRLALLAAVFAVLTTAATAFAQSPANTVYNPGGDVLNVVTGKPKGQPKGPPPTDTTPETDTPRVQHEAGASPQASGSLPFTGFEAGLVAMAGLALAGAGFAMRRVTRSGS